MDHDMKKERKKKKNIQHQSLSFPSHQVQHNSQLTCLLRQHKSPCPTTGWGDNPGLDGHERPGWGRNPGFGHERPGLIGIDGWWTKVHACSGLTAIWVESVRWLGW